MGEIFKELKSIGQYHNEGSRVISRIIQCPNPDCEKHTIDIFEFQAEEKLSGSWRKTNKEQLIHVQLYPDAAIKIYPAFVPAAILTDYKEAKLISTLSPKASATLARRCIQGILRDFCKVRPGRLVDEIAEIEPKVDIITWEAIDGTRKIGNIGAHMEKDLIVIIDVDANEAALRLDFNETLTYNGYVQTYEMELRIAKIQNIATTKKP